MRRTAPLAWMGALLLAGGGCERPAPDACERQPGEAEQTCPWLRLDGLAQRRVPAGKDGPIELRGQGFDRRDGLVLLQNGITVPDRTILPGGTAIRFNTRRDMSGRVAVT